MLFLQSGRQWNRRRIIADGITFFLYTACTGWIIVGYEKYVCDLAIEQVAILRMMSGVPRVALGFACGMVKNAVKRRWFAGSSEFLSQAAAGAIALCLFQLPLYVGSALILSTGARQIIVTCILYIASDILFGWSYVYLLEYIRARFRVYAAPDP